jgi:hypothetical protein
VPLTGIAFGYAKINAGASGLAGASAGLTVLPPSGLIGRWFNGNSDLLDKSGYTPAGTHNGVLSDGLSPAFSADVPAGASGSSLDLATSGGAVLITNTTTAEPGYLPTFDDGVSRQVTVVFWAKGLPGQWNPFVSKYGEGSAGWQVRRRGGDRISTFTVRGTGGEDDPFNGSTYIDDGNWHQFTATWDGAAGVRKLYVDGQLNNFVGRDVGPMGIPNASYLTLGGRCDPNATSPGNLFFGQLYDVRVYGTALNGSTVQRLFNGNTTSIIAYSDTSVVDPGHTGTISVSIPNSANASTPVTVYVTNTTPSVISLPGQVANIVTIVFPAGGVYSQSLTVTALAEGTGTVSCGASGLTGGSTSIKVYGPHTIGQWFNGTESYTNGSTFTPTGTHDGTEVGSVGTLTFSTDTPPSKPGKSAQFGGSVGLMINNSCVLDGGYLPTFDDAISHQFSVSFWAKGTPGQWSPWITKRGEDNLGWQVRRHSSSPNATFTIRGGGAGNDDPQGSKVVTDGLWHHYAAVWDGWGGARKLYIDGALDPAINLTGDIGPLMVTPNHHLILGARETSGVSATPAIESGLSGNLYDVRLFNYPLSPSDIQTLSFIAAIRVTPLARSLHAPQSMTVDIVLPTGANQSQAVTVYVTNNTPTIASLSGAVGNVVTLNYPISGSLTQQVTVAGITNGQAILTAAGGGLSIGTGTFNVWADVGPRLIGHWVSGNADLADTSGFRPAGKHDGVAVGPNAGSIGFSSDVPPNYSGVSLDLNIGNAAVEITNSALSDSGYVETFDNQVSNRFSIAFWAKGTFPNDWNPWVAKRGEDGQGYQVRRFGGDNPIRPTFTIRGTPSDDDPHGNTQVDASQWHHYAGTWDGSTGVRKLYLDGNPIITLSGDTGPLSMAVNDHLTLGGRDYNGVGNYWNGLLYDVRFYSYALDPLDVGVLSDPPQSFTITVGPLSIPQNEIVSLVIRLPVGSTAGGPVTVYLTNNSPTVCTIVGSSGPVFPVVFPTGTLAKQVFLQTIGPGVINITAGAGVVGSTSLATVNTVYTTNMIGHWIGGTADLADSSGFTPVGTHQGMVVGSNPGSLAFSPDVPAGFSGNSLDLTANAVDGSVGVIVSNSATADAGYLTTFDDAIAYSFSVALWTKGLPNTWNPFISKRGEDGIGWQVRRHGGDNTETFTIRGAGAGNDDPNGSVNITGGQWHHFAAVWDGIAGTRKCYVDGVLDPSINLTGDTGPMSLAPNHHVGIGVRESGGAGSFESWFNGKLYDVRIYNYAISASAVTTLVNPNAGRPTLTVQRWTGNQLRIAWPSSFSDFGLQQSTNPATGWVTSGLLVGPEGAENAAYAPLNSSRVFYRLKK